MVLPKGLTQKASLTCTTIGGCWHARRCLVTLGVTIGSKLGFSVLPMGNWICGQFEPGSDPPTLRSLNDPLYQVHKFYISFSSSWRIPNRCSNLMWHIYRFAILCHQSICVFSAAFCHCLPSDGLFYFFLLWAEGRRKVKHAVSEFCRVECENSQTKARWKKSLSAAHCPPCAWPCEISNFESWDCGCWLVEQTHQCVLCSHGYLLQTL